MARVIWPSAKSAVPDTTGRKSPPGAAEPDCVCHLTCTRPESCWLRLIRNTAETAPSLTCTDGVSSVTKAGAPVMRRAVPLDAVAMRVGAGGADVAEVCGCFAF